jgi:hypothetical protein
MKAKNLFLLPALALFAGAGLQAQVTIGGLAYPTAGAILDLNSDTKGGLVLSNVAITSLDSIPAGTGYFPGVDTLALRVFNPKLRGAIVYNTHPATVPGVYVWTGERWMPFGETVQEEKDQILFTIRIENDNDNYFIPTSGYLNGISHVYDWDITVDGQSTTVCPDGRCQGTSGTTLAGIQLTGLSSGDHHIRITPHGDEEAGWGNAFGHYSGNAGANATDNKQKLISIDAPLSTLAFAPKTTGPESVNTTSATNMFAYMFSGCSKLTTPAVIRDNYKLPETITDLSYFLSNTHYGNTSLEQPIDLTSLEEWFTNPTISDLSHFLYYTHNSNASLEQPIDLTPLTDWFSGNQTITNLSHFLSATHFSNTSLEQPIVLTPLENWFSDNQTITNLSDFLSDTHFNNTSLTEPIVLTPLRSWFTDEHPIIDLSYFLSYTHYNNISLKLEDKPIFPNWVKTIKQGTTQAATSILDVNTALSRTFYLSSEQGGDIGEPQYENGTVLSSMGAPSNHNKQTYSNRTGIIPNNNNWK